MIRRIELTGWKAFDSLTFEPGPGVTFVIARNGTGKSSLLDGISWGTFGERSGIDPVRMARAGSSATQVIVELDGPDRQPLRIERSLDAPVRATLGEAALGTEELADALRTIFGANLDFAARATTLGHSTLLDQARSFEYLGTHLADVFGITHLRDATVAVEDAYTKLKRANSKLRAATRAQPDVAALRERATELAVELDGLVAQRPDVQRELDASAEVQRRADATKRAAGDLARWQEASVDLSARADDIAGPGDGDLPRRVEAALARIEDTISTITRTIGAAEASVVAAQSSLGSLATPGALCPTCRRPLSEHERSAAQREHQSTVVAATSEAEAAQGQLDKATRDRDLLRELLRDVERLGPAPPQMPTVATSEEVGLALEHAQAQMGDLERRIGERQGALSEIERTIRSASAAAEAEGERLRAIRREAVAQLAASVMRSTVDELMEQRIGPMADEVSARWKQVFGDRGMLRMSPHGEISMERDGHSISFASFSPGEQVVSMLALRFLTVAASTTSPFMLLDEPLECLDPPNRRLIASVLVGADRPVGQMIVTTYEEALVRRIHATMPDIDVRVIS